MDRQKAQREGAQLAAEVAAVESVSPTLDDLHSETPGSIDTIDPRNGERRTYYKHPGLTAAENEANGRRVSQMMADRRRVSREVSAAREARRDDVEVIDPAGNPRRIRADREEATARKAGFKPRIKWGRPKWRKRESEYRRELNDAAGKG